MDVIILDVVNKEVIRIQSDDTFAIFGSHFNCKNNGCRLFVDQPCNVHEVLTLHLVTKFDSVYFMAHSVHVFIEPLLIWLLIRYEYVPTQIPILVRSTCYQVRHQSNEAWAEAALGH